MNELGREVSGHVVRGILVILGTIMLSGCAAAVTGYPTPVVDPSTLSSLNEYLQPTAIAKYDSTLDADRGGLNQRQWRDAVIDAHVLAADVYFREFKRSLSSQEVSLAILTDWTVLGLNAAGALVAGSVANILSGTSAGVVGARTSVDKNAYYTKTLPALISAMEARRKEVLVRIRTSQQKDVVQYSLSSALDDLNSYEDAGSIIGAVTEITTVSGASVEASDEKLKSLIKIGPVSLDIQARKVAAANYVRDLAKQNQKAVIDRLADALRVTRSEREDIKDERADIIYRIDAVQNKSDMDQISQKIKSVVPGKEF